VQCRKGENRLAQKQRSRKEMEAKKNNSANTAVCLTTCSKIT